MSVDTNKKIDALEHFVYEMRMLIITTSYLRNIGTISQYILNSTLESWCLHLRNLLLFYNESGNKKDITIFCYLDKDINKNSIDEKRDSIIDIKLLNRRVAHLSFDRLYPNIAWHFFDIYKNFASFYNDFAKNLLNNSDILKSEFLFLNMPYEENELYDIFQRIIHNIDPDIILIQKK